MSNRADVEQQRIGIFEEYANGGLDLLDRELCGAVDYTERILLMLSVETKQRMPHGEMGSAANSNGEDLTSTNPAEFDLRKFLG